jgi:pimeloyl-ACP methyl ester carboxylesterase
MVISTRRKALNVIASLLLPISAWAAAQDHFFESAGVSIRFEDRGRGTAVVLVHGWSETAKMWADTDDERNFLENFRVIAIDCRGHGS